jgi:hypothetical protein
MGMIKHIFALFLVSVVSGCVTSDGPYSQSAARQARAQQVVQGTGKAVRPPEGKRTQIIVGAAY